MTSGMGSAIPMTRRQVGEGRTSGPLALNSSQSMQRRMPAEADARNTRVSRPLRWDRAGRHRIIRGAGAPGLAHLLLAEKEKP